MTHGSARVSVVDPARTESLRSKVGCSAVEGRCESRIEIVRDWRGAAAPAEEHAFVEIALDGGVLEVVVDARYHGDPAPATAPGSTERLWEHEVVELFLLGERERYVEVELGPHGHYLVLRLGGARHVVERPSPIDYVAHIREPRWSGRARLALVPEPLLAANAYAMHGAGAARRYLAAHPVPGHVPDFHRLDCFRPIEWRAATR